MFEPKSFFRRTYRWYFRGKRCRDRENLPVKTNLVRLPYGYAKSDMIAVAIVILKPYGFSDILFAIKLA